MPGVITLGEEYINAQQQVDSKTAERNNLTTQIEKDNAELEKSRSSKTIKKGKFEDSLWKTRGQELKKIFGGGGDFRSKEAFANKVRATKSVERSLDDIIVETYFILICSYIANELYKSENECYNNPYEIPYRIKKKSTCGLSEGL